MQTFIYRMAGTYLVCLKIQYIPYYNIYTIKNTIYSITYTTSSILCSFNFMHSKDSKICCTTTCHFSCQQTSKEQVCTMSSTPPCPTQTDGRASVHDPNPNFRAPRTSMPTFSLLLQQCESAVFPLRGEQSEQALVLV